jgi:tetratricopeptide (TPR) repeat protein
MDRFSAHMDRAWELVIQGQTLEASVAAQKALEVDGNSPEAHNLLGYIHAMDGDLEDALLHYQQAMDLDEAYIDPLLNSAELLSHPDADPEEAIRLCRCAAALVSAPEELVEAILLEVEALMNLGRAADARARLADIENLDALPDAYAILLGRAFYEAGDPVGSKVYVDKAIAHDPKNADAWYYYGLIARFEGRRIDAVKAFAKVREQDLTDPLPPWAKQIEPLDTLVGRALKSVSEEVRGMLAATEVVVEAYPSEAQILAEIDPRQVVFAEGVNLAHGSFERLFVFSRNMLRAGIMPDNAETDLARMISREVLAEQEII